MKLNGITACLNRAPRFHLSSETASTGAAQQWSGCLVRAGAAPPVGRELHRLFMGRVLVAQPLPATGALLAVAVREPAGKRPGADLCAPRVGKKNTELLMRTKLSMNAIFLRARELVLMLAKTARAQMKLTPSSCQSILRFSLMNPVPV